MRLYQRACLVLASEGVAGLLRRVRRVIVKRPAPSREAIGEEYGRLQKAFREHTLRSGCYDEVKDYYWYHTVDLGRGLLTPGSYDYRSSLPAFRFPPDMAGMDVLDVGSGTGFFAFEFERRGADVTSVELPSFDDFDRFPGETTRQLLNNYEASLRSHTNSPPEQCARLFREKPPGQLHHLLLDGPFEFCRKALGSKVRRCYSRIYDLSGERLGKDGFDLVFVGDVLLHTVYPLKALAAVAPLCRGTLVISQDLPEAPGLPAMLYVGGDRAGEDGLAWWLPNKLCLQQILRKMGFHSVEVVGRNTGFLRPSGGCYDRAIVHAFRRPEG
jgi:tRNA (mo5U34)-methyltransferase